MESKYKLIVTEAGCHECISHISKVDGYTRVKRHGKNILLHRYAAEQKYGSLGDNLVLHKCHNRACVNPEHLYLGTRQQNSTDRIKDRTHGFKLTDEDAISIYQDSRPNDVICEDYGITNQTVSKIKLKQQWKHIHQ
jgi:hypothetical protein